MTRVTLRIPTPLRSFTSGAAQLSVQAGTVREALRFAGKEHAALTERILDEDGELRTFVNLFVGSTNVARLDGLDTSVADGDVLAILPAVAGGVR